MELIKLLSIFFIFVISTLSNPAYSSDLDEFEKSAHKPKKSTETIRYRAYDDKSDNDKLSDSFLGAMFEGVFQIMGELLVRGVAEGGRRSWHKSESSFDRSEHETLNDRIKGDYLVPFVKLDAGLGKLESDIDLQDYMTEVGYGPLSVSYRHTRFHEDTPSDILTASQWFLNYRMTLGDHVQTDIGLGKYRLKGSQYRTDPAIRFGFTWFAFDQIGASYNYYSTVGEHLDIEDHEWALLYRFNYWSLKTSYRKINGGSKHLKGPSIGISYHF